MAERTLALAADFCARSLNVRYDGIAIASRIPMMMTTTRSSMSVKPDSSRARRLLISALTLVLLPEDDWLPAMAHLVSTGRRPPGTPQTGDPACPETWSRLRVKVGCRA